LQDGLSKESRVHHDLAVIPECEYMGEEMDRLVISPESFIQKCMAKKDYEAAHFSLMHDNGTLIEIISGFSTDIINDVPSMW